MKVSVMLFSAFFLLVLKLSAQEASSQELSNNNSGPALEGGGKIAAENPSETKKAVAELSSPSLELVFPDYPGWNVVNEGENLSFSVKAAGGSDSSFYYSIAQGRAEGIMFDSAGAFSWTPGHDFVNRLSSDSTFQILFEAQNKNAEKVSQVVELKVVHVNRPPVVGELKPFYLRYNTRNVYTIESSVVKDEDQDPVVFLPVMDVMPEGSRLSEQGEFTWTPSVTQFNNLRREPLVLEFYVEDQPSKARTKGHFTIKATQQDLPPSIQMVPSQKHFEYSEDATINLKFQLYDPNGDNDIASFSFVSDNKSVPASALVKNTPSQYEFIWKPGYDFVRDPLDSVHFSLTFYVLDRSNKKEERTISFSVLNAINEPEKDLKMYNEYRGALVRAWDLSEQLKEAEKDLKKKYRKAKRGKKARSITNASLGAATGISPVVVEVPATSKKITAIGGTAVMTIGTLEATEVIGRSTRDLVERLNYIMEKKNELQTKGDIYARKYALKSSRRSPDFLKDTDNFVAVMNLKGLVALELDANWQNKSKPTNSNVTKTFKDFNPQE